MKINLILIFSCSFLLFISCGKTSNSNNTYVQDIKELKEAIHQAKPGSEIILSNGIWKDVQINFYGNGTKENPITLKAETEGKVFIEGQSFFHLGGEFLNVEGLHFRNGFSPNTGIIRFKIGLDSVANNSSVKNCVIEEFNNPNVSIYNQWIEFFGKHNQINHCYISGKTNNGPTLMVYHNGNENTSNYHQIVNNYFGARPRNSGTNAHTIQLGNSKTRLTPGRATFSNNYFEACNGDEQIISDMTNYNSFINNIFYKCEGALVLRHGNFATVDKNIFIGGDESNLYGGLSVMNTGHWITNNYFYKIKGEGFKSPLAIMNGIKNTPLQGFRQVTDVVIAFNSWIDCQSTWQIGVGQNKASIDSLPFTEIRSEPPIRSIIANNLIYNTQVDASPLINFDDMDGIAFKNNIIDNSGEQYMEFNVFRNEKLKMKQLNDWLFIPDDEKSQKLNEVFYGYDFGKIKNDLFENSRTVNNSVGAINNFETIENFQINKKRYGPKWYSPAKFSIK
ncbi:chondroitinase-B domain-containing protein [Aurantibacter sp.]|uniref:chondroitinase-B domain-containing protein n=1 Tax=Aurantibacter sp. TaxID=2807103 RepID=UPI00326739E0